MGSALFLHVAFGENCMLLYTCAKPERDIGYITIYYMNSPDVQCIYVSVIYIYITLTYIDYL